MPPTVVLWRIPFPADPAVLRSREKPDTADQHETALRCAEKLVRRNPPDLAHRAPELSRDLLYLEDSFDLEVQARQNALEAMLQSIAFNITPIAYDQTRVACNRVTIGPRGIERYSVSFGGGVQGERYYYCYF